MELAAIVALLFNLRTLDAVSIDQMAADLVNRDVVFLGEEHDSPECHRFQLEIVKKLHRMRPDLVLSLEMFERDVQGPLDDYLRGRISEESFRAESRPWKHYQEFYRPIIEYAKVEGLDVLAANAPGALVHRVGKKGLVGIDGERWAAWPVDARKGRYFELFDEAMNDSEGHAVKGEKLEHFFEAQCLRDQTMADSIAAYLDSRPYRQPLIVHLCGKFHSDEGLGTVSRLLGLRPLTQVGVVSTRSVEHPSKWKPQAADRKLGHYLLVVPETKDENEKKAGSKDHPATSTRPKSRPASHPTSKPSTRPAVAVVPEVELGGRPALGFTPSYLADGQGVGVEALRPGGPAEKAGIEVGDRVVGLAGEPVADIQEYVDVLSDFSPGDTIEVELKRGAKTLKLKLVLGSR